MALLLSIGASSAEMMNRLSSSTNDGRSLFFAFAKLFVVPFLFTIYAATVRLTVQPHPKRFIDPLLPADTKIFIMKSDPVFLAQLAASLDNQRVVLIFGIQQGGGKSIEISGRRLHSTNQPHIVTTRASLLLMKHHLPKVLGQAVMFIDFNRAAALDGELLNRINTTAEFLIGVNIGIIKKPGNFVSLKAKLP